MWICSLCRLLVAKNNFWQFLKFGVSCTDPLVPMRIKYGVLEQTQSLHLHAKLHLNVFIVSASNGQKTILGKFWLWGFLYWPPFTDDGQIWCAIADPWLTLVCQISTRSVYSIALWRRKTPTFAVCYTSAFSGVANWQQSEKVEQGCTTTNLPLSNVIKIVSVVQRLHGEIGRIN